MKKMPMMVILKAIMALNIYHNDWNIMDDDNSYYTISGDDIF